MKLHEMNYTNGSRKDKFRKGRGHGSGNGKTAGRGHKGQNARSGGGVRPGFEGGQTPLFRALPKRGFTNFTRREYAIINLSQLETFSQGSEVNPQILKERGLIKKELNGIKVLGKGILTKKLTVKASKFSASAIKAINEAGGSVEVI